MSAFLWLYSTPVCHCRTGRKDTEKHGEPSR